LAQKAPRRAGAPRTAPRARRRSRRRSRAGDDEGVLAVLAKTVRRVEAAAQRGKIRPSGRTAYQVVALLVREERARVKADISRPEAERAAVLTRLDGIATILAMTAARDTSLLELLAEGAVVSTWALSLKNDMLRAGGREPNPKPEQERKIAADLVPSTRRVVPQTVIAHQLANPFLAPDFSAVPSPRPIPNRLGDWELLTPYFAPSSPAATPPACRCPSLPRCSTASRDWSSCITRPR